MAEENLNTKVPVEENGTLDPLNGHEEASEPSSTLEKDEDDEKKEEDDGKGDDFLLDESFFILVFGSHFIIHCLSCQWRTSPTYRVAFELDE